MPISLLNHIDVSFLSLYIAFIPLSIAQRIAALKDIGAFSFLELNKGIIQMQVTIKLTR